MYETAKDAIRSACEVATKDGWKVGLPTLGASNRRKGEDRE